MESHEETKVEVNPANQDKKAPFRKMATWKKIDAVNALPNNNDFEVAVFGGWSALIKKGAYKSGEEVVYCEVDSWLPEALISYLPEPPKSQPEEYKGVKGVLLDTSKQGDIILQGAVLPLSILGEKKSEYKLGSDVSKAIGVFKWDESSEAGDATPVSTPSSTEGDKVKKEKKPKEKVEKFQTKLVNSAFPTFIPQTDQERLQNLKDAFEGWKKETLTWEVTEKLEGQSMTVYYNAGEFGVCSRGTNLVWEPAPSDYSSKEMKTNIQGNKLWNQAINYELDKKIKATGRNLAVQGELVGPGVEGNIYNYKDNNFYVYDIFDIDKQEYLSPKEREEMVKVLGVKHVPFIEVYSLKEEDTVDSLLKKADGYSKIASDQRREGYVYKCYERKESFKTVSNEYLAMKDELKNAGKKKK